MSDQANQRKSDPKQGADMKPATLAEEIEKVCMGLSNTQVGVDDNHFDERDYGVANESAIRTAKLLIARPEIQAVREALQVTANFRHYVGISHAEAMSIEGAREGLAALNKLIAEVETLK